MRTDDLVTLLAAGATPVKQHAAARRVGLALGWGFAVTLLLLLLTMGPRADLRDAMALPMFWAKLAFSGSLALAAAVAVERLARPGVRLGAIWLALVLPVGMLALAATAVMLAVEPAERMPLVMGSTWQVCPLAIAALSLPMLGSALWALRGLAPTRPALAGALAGLLAGTVGAFVYALHCTEMQAPFIAIWYGLGIAVPAVAGALLGRRLLRW